MFKRFCKRMKSKRYRLWLLQRIAAILALLLFLAVIAALVVTPIVSKADTGDVTEETTAATVYTTKTETAATEPPTAQQPTEKAYTYYNCELSEDLQNHVFTLCEEKQIDPAIIVAMCWKESTCNPDQIGDDGNAFGLMQVQPRWHYERMLRLDCTDLLDPYQNITVGVDFLSELLERYGSIDKALTAYNKGHYAGTVTHYASSVLEQAEALRGDTYVLYR